MKKIIDKLGFIKIKNLCSQKENVKRMRKQSTDWEIVFQKTPLVKNSYPKYTKNT